MSLTSAGWTAIASLLIGDAAVTAFNSANAYLGVGDSTTAFATGQTDLQAATNKLRKAMTSGSYPSRSSNVITFQSTFGTSDANWQWNENAIFNASTAGTMLTRAVETLITKTSAVSVVFTKTLTIQS